MSASKTAWVYIMASQRNGTLYIGVTSDLRQRASEHRDGIVPGFTTKHGCKTLVWYERHDTIEGAIDREKSLKRYERVWKLDLIEAFNPSWHDLIETCQTRDNPFEPTFSRRFASTSERVGTDRLELPC